MNKNKWRLDGKRAVITGGTKGIGLAVAEEILNLGGEVFIVARDQNLINQKLKEWKQKDFKAYGFAADVSTKEGRNNLFKAINETWDKFEILVNNVGTNIRKKASRLYC